MPYCTQTDIINSIPEQSVIDLTDDSGTGIIDSTKLNSAITDADSLINGYLRARYNAPLDPVPDEIRLCSVELTIYFLYKRRYSSEMPDFQKENYKNQIKFLESVAKGVIVLTSSLVSTASESIYKTNKTSSDRIFSKSALDKM